MCVWLCACVLGWWVGWWVVVVVLRLCVIRHVDLAEIAACCLLLGYFMSCMQHLAPAVDVPTPAVAGAPVEKSEIEKYLELPDEPMSTDILVWWAKKESEFPLLRKMARQYLGIPATSASAERLFSIAGRCFGDLRQKMCEEMLEELMWARINKGSRAK